MKDLTLNMRNGVVAGVEQRAKVVCSDKITGTWKVDNVEVLDKPMKRS